MNACVKKGLYCALFVGGLSLLGVGAANAAETSGESGVASGSQIAPDLTAPIVIDGNAISLLEDSTSSGSTTDAAPSGSEAGTATTDGTDGTASGTQVAPDANAPVTVEGNAISLLGDTSTTGTSTTGTSTTGTSTTGTNSTTGDDAAATTDGTDGTASGTQLAPDANAPVTVEGNAISLLGDTSTTGSAEEVSVTPSTDTTGNDGAAVTDVESPLQESALPFVRSLRALVSPLGADAVLNVNGDTATTTDGLGDGATIDGNIDGTANGSNDGTDVAVGVNGGLETAGNAGSDEGEVATGAEGVIGGADGTVATGIGSNSTADGDSAGTVFESAAATAITADGMVSLPSLAVTNASWTEPSAKGSAIGTMSAEWLASTGVTVSPLLGLVALFPLMGFALLLAARREASQA